MHASLTIRYVDGDYHFTWTSSNAFGRTIQAMSMSNQPQESICLVGTTQTDSQKIETLQAHISAAAQALTFTQRKPTSSGYTEPLDVNDAFDALGRLLFGQLVPLQIQHQIRILPSGSVLQIVTNDLNLPWELLHDGRDFVAFQHAVARLPMLEQPQRQHRLSRSSHSKVSCLLLGNPTNDLPETSKEIRAIADVLYQARDRVRFRSLYRDQVTSIALQEQLARQEHDLIHFAGHARPGKLHMADGWFSAPEIRDSLHNHPIVVLNACASAQAIETSEVDLTTVTKDAESLATAFIQGGARAVIGMLWPVPDQTMKQFGQTLYGYLVQGESIGHALQRSRNAIRETDPTGLSWLAPVLYGNPMERVVPAALKEAAGTLLAIQFHGEMVDHQQVASAKPDDLQYYLAFLCRRISHHGGQIFYANTGGLLAAFGIYQASNRDAVQAILAARDMRELAATWRAPRPSIAIVSGEIAVEQINGRHNRSEERHTENGVSLSSESWNVSERSPYLIGQPVTEVQQLVSSAKSGQILVNQLAFERSRDRFHYDAWMGTLAGEQHSEAYELMTYATETSTSGLERLNLDISVGRGDEQRRLEEAWRKAVDGHGQVIGISGEAGIGKTHLVNQLLKSIESATNGCRQIQVTCTYEVQNSSYGLLAHLFRALLGLPNFAPGEAIDDTLRIHFADKTPTETSLLRGLIGIQEQERPRQEQAVYQHQLYQLLKHLLIRETRQCALLLILEDAHLSDSASLDVLTQLVSEIEAAPILMLLLYRLDWQPPWSGKDQFQNINLGQLHSKTRQDLLRSLLRSTQLPDELVILLDHLGGNPLFLIEILVRLIHRGLLVEVNSQVGNGHSASWQLRGHLDPGDLPDTIQRTIEMRLDQLDESVRAVLEKAAVMGTSFTVDAFKWDQSLSHEQLLGNLQTLTKQDLLRQNWGGDTYEFRHGLIQDVAYMKIPVPLRQLWHRQIADVSEQWMDNRRELVNRVAHHYYYGLLEDALSDPVRLTNPEDAKLVEKTLYYLLLAAKDAADHYATHEARTFYRRAEQVDRLLPRNIERQTQIQMGLGDAAGLLGNFDEAQQAYEEVQASIHRQPLTVATRPQAAHADRLLARVYMWRAKYETAEAWIKVGLEQIQNIEDTQCLAAAAMLQIHGGSICYNRGDLKQATTFVESGLEIADTINNEDAQAEGYYLMGAIMQRVGRNDEALDSYKRAMVIHQQRQNQYQIHRIEMNIAVVYFNIAKWTKARIHFERAYQFWQKIGEQEMLTPTSINLGIAEHYLGNWCKAQQLYSLALVICQETQSQRWLARCHSNLGSLFVDQSEWFRAKEHLELSYEILQKHNIQDFMADVLTSLAYVHLGYHDTDEALRLAIQAKELAVQTDLQLDLALALRAEGSVLAAQGDVSAAEKTLQQSLEILRTLNNAYEAARTTLQIAIVKEETKQAEDALTLCIDAKQVFERLEAAADLRKAQDLYLYFLVKEKR